jgi:hypothetical protein
MTTYSEKAVEWLEQSQARVVGGTSAAQAARVRERCLARAQVYATLHVGEMLAQIKDEGITVREDRP